MRNFIILLTFIFIGTFANASLFSAKDKAFSIDLPSQWKITKDDKSPLALKNGDAVLKVKEILSCNNLPCLENKVNEDLSALKKKNVKLIQNSYSSEIVKRTELPTGDTMLSFNFKQNNKDSTYGYFSADNRTFKIEITGIPYVEADLALSFVSPKPKQSTEMLNEPLPDPLMEDIDIGTLSHQVESAPEIKTQNDEELQEKLNKLKQEINENKETTPQTQKEIKNKNIFSNIPIPYLVLFGYITLYFIVWIGFFAYKFFFSKKDLPTTANPNSAYPIITERLYGSPDLFFSIYDNQGQKYILTTSRWDKILLGFGLLSVVFFLLCHIILTTLVNSGFYLHPAIANTILSICILFSILGLIMACSGLMLGWIFPSNILLYSSKGKMLLKIKRGSINLLTEEFLCFTNKGILLFTLRKKRFSFLRQWDVFSTKGLIAQIKEYSYLRSILRKLFGHLSGTLRTNYLIKGRNDSNGEIVPYKTISATFKIDLDKPQAIPSQIMVGVAGVILIRDRDLPHPWIN